MLKRSLRPCLDAARGCVAPIKDIGPGCVECRIITHQACIVIPDPVCDSQIIDRN